MNNRTRFNKYLYTYEVGLWFLDKFNYEKQQKTQRQSDENVLDTQHGTLKPVRGK